MRSSPCLQCGNENVKIFRGSYQAAALDRNNNFLGNSRRDQPPTPKKLRQPQRPVYAMDVPNDSVGATGDGQKQNSTCKIKKD